MDCHSNPISHKRSLRRQARPHAIQECSESKLEMVCAVKGGREKTERERTEWSACLSAQLSTFGKSAGWPFLPLALQGTLKRGFETQENDCGPRPET
ncbi:uncharacterized [Tachysurus ichikawai]